jgi:UDP-N-acetylglucosamine acyltransferase
MKYRGEESALVIGDNNTIREAVTINLGTEGGGGTTRIGKCNLLMAYVHVAHDCSVGDNVVIGNCCQIAGHVRIEDWAVIGGLTGVSQRVRIGAHSYIGGCSGIDRDVAPFTLGRGPTGGFVISGMNLVGLKRRGFNREELAALQAVSRLFFKDKMLEKNDVLNQLERGWGSIEVVQQFIRFVRTSAKGVFR